MASILLIETSTACCSVALSRDGIILYRKEERNGPSHATLLGMFVEDALAFSRSTGIPLDAVAVSAGPGSYTGLRIGVSTAKGVCFAMHIPLIAVSTLETMACGVLFRHELPEDALLCPMIDARRMEVYAAIYDRSLQPIKPISADIIDADSYREILAEHPVYFFGDGSDKCRAILQSKQAHFIAGEVPLASDMMTLAEIAFRAGRFEDVAYYEPFYLKEFIATKPKQLI